LGRRERGAGSGTLRCSARSCSPLPAPRELHNSLEDREFPPAYRAPEHPGPHHAAAHFSRGHHEEPLVVGLRAAQDLRQVYVPVSRTPPTSRDPLRRARVASSSARPPPPPACSPLPRRPTPPSAPRSRRRADC